MAGYHQKGGLYKMPDICMICKELKPLSVSSYYRYKDSTLTELRGWVCGDCAKGENRKIAKAYSMMAKLRGEVNELFITEA
jgi:hypothetical protein